jgi:nucleotide-binding universal stress UspA family protein
LHFVAPLLSRQKPEITVLHVQETQLGESGEFAEACLISGDKTLKDYRHAPITKAASGDYVEETLRELISGDYDLVVLGAYGHERPKMIKAISDEALTLVSRTTRPVLVYREKE